MKNSIIIAIALILGQLKGSGQEQKDQNFFAPVYSNVNVIEDFKSLQEVSIPNTTIVSVTLDEKTNACNVLALVNHPPANDSVKVWIALPLKNWNGRFLGTGGGGFVGGMPQFEEPLSKGFAVGATNTGHDGGSGSFALNDKKQLNWQLIRDNAYLGIHDMTVVGKALVEAFYKKPAKYTYFLGGSTGGRQGLSEAQRYPEDYNGIVSFYPAINWHRFLIAELWPQVVMHELENYIPVKKFEEINKAIIEELDAKDGFKDGVIENPLETNFNLKSLIGRSFKEYKFTEKDALVIAKIWEGPKTKEGEFLWYGLPIGTEFTALAETQGEPLTGKPFFISQEWVRYFLRNDPEWEGIPLTQEEFQLLWNQSVEQYRGVFGTDNPNLKSFKTNGSKLMIIHGLSDRLIFPQGSIHYYERVKQKMGEPEETYDFARLFLIPGLDHSYQNPVLQPINYLESMINWVENNIAPENVEVEHRDKDGKITRRAFYEFIK